MWNRDEITVVEPFNNYVEAYRVSSDSIYKAAYLVAKTRAGEWNCTCPHWLFRRPEYGCKHMTYVAVWKEKNNIMPAPVAFALPVEMTRFAALDV